MYGISIEFLYNLIHTVIPLYSRHPIQRTTCYSGQKALVPERFLYFSYHKTSIQRTRLQRTPGYSGHLFWPHWTVSPVYRPIVQQQTFQLLLMCVFYRPHTQKFDVISLTSLFCCSSRRKHFCQSACIGHGAQG